eukprot:c14348_g1_i1 orf=316-2028(+)
MSLLINSSRCRKVLFAAAAIAAGGYTSYRIYTSSAFTRRRKRLLQLLSTLSFCCEAVSQSAESISILSSDLKSFLLSDDDSLPHSLKQAFKIGQSEEFQDSVTVLSAALTRGLLRGFNAKPGKEGHVRGHGQGHGQHSKPGFQAWQVKDADVVSEDAACREIREVGFTDKRHERLGSCELDRECVLLSNVEKGGSDCQEWKSYTSGSDMHFRRSRKVGIVLDRTRRGKPSEGLLDRLFLKLFSEPGVGFASAVAGTLARSLVLAFFNAAQKQGSSNKDLGSASSANGSLKTLESMEERTPSYARIIDVMTTNSSRMLISECIQTFITTAVTVYIDKTKDVNFYDDMVAGITNPSHRDPMKDLLTSVCNSAIETLLKTSYGVMVADKNGQNGMTNGRQQSQWGIQEHSPLCARGQLPSSMEDYCEEANHTQTEDLTSDEQSDAQATFVANSRVSIGMFQGNKTRGVQSFIDGFFKTLAIPSNRKLVVDVAGTMTSEAVRSFVDVVVSTASSHIGSKMHGSWDRVKSYVSDQQGLQFQERSRSMAVKAFVLASICLAICLHMLTGFQILQNS